MAKRARRKNPANPGRGMGLGALAAGAAAVGVGLWALTRSRPTENGPPPPPPPPPLGEVGISWIVYDTASVGQLLDRASSTRPYDSAFIFSGAVVGSRTTILDPAFVSSSAAQLKQALGGIRCVAITGSESAKISTLAASLGSDPNVDLLGFQYAPYEAVYSDRASDVLDYERAQALVIRASGKPFLFFPTGRPILVEQTVTPWDYGAFALECDEMGIIMHVYCAGTYGSTLGDAMAKLEAQFALNNATTPYAPQINIGTRLHGGVTGANGAACREYAKSLGRSTIVGWDGESVAGIEDFNIFLASVRP